MFRYLKAAFFQAVPLGPLGALPLNLLAVLSLGILGFGHPGFWLIGVALETAYLCGLAFNPRYQRLVNSNTFTTETDLNEQQCQEIVRQLDAESRRRLEQLNGKCLRILELYRNLQVSGYVADTNRDALTKLKWVHLKLMTAQHYLRSPEAVASESALAAQAAALEKELQDGGQSPALRESKAATLKIVFQRIENLRRRQRTLAEIQSDLTRVEAQVDLALENASMQERPETISTDIDLASHLLDSEFFGPSQPVIAEIDRRIAATPAEKERAAPERVRRKA